MKQLLLLAFLLLSCSISGATHHFAQQAKSLIDKQHSAFGIARRDVMPMTLGKSASRRNLRRVEESVEDSFIFDPIGEEKMYCMSEYSYDQTNQKFVHATSMKSQVRFDSDGKTVYFKDLLPSLGVETWLKGNIDGDTIRVAFGQPLAYYRSKYLIFFCPMIYNDSTGVMDAQDEFKLIIHGDSLMAPTYSDGIFQCAAGYVFISESTQGSLSYDLDHQMRQITEQSIAAPTDVEAKEYIMTYENSTAKISKTKINVKQKGDDLYLQLSTSAPNAYIYGHLEGDSIKVPSGQMITDSTFIYYYSLALPVYNDTTQEVEDFLPASDDACHLYLDPTTQTITSTKDLFGVDYMDGMEMCMDFTQNMRLDPYAGDMITKPMSPEWRSLNIGADVYQPYVSFNIPNLDVDSNYINPEKISYSLLFDVDVDSLNSANIEDYIYPFEHSNYMNISETMTQIPYYFKDGYDFFIYSSLHYVYIYESLFDNIGVQTIYTVDGVEQRSDVALYDFASGKTSSIPMKNDVTGITNIQEGNKKAQSFIYNLAGQRVADGYRGIKIKNGHKVIR